MRKFAIVFGLFVVGLFISVGMGIAPSKKRQAPEETKNDQQQQMQELAQATLLLNQGKTEEALALIHAHKADIESLSENGIRWLDLFIAASIETRDVPQLVVLFEFFPEIYKDNEKASLLVADAYIAGNKVKDYNKIRSLWQDRETQIAAWYVLDVDLLLLQGRRQDAVALLKSRTFKDKADVGRLIRLALMVSNDDPKEAWKYLGEAYSKDPKNPDIRSYRAKVLENAGKHSLAHKEYQAAVRLDPANMFLKDQLADFYIRQKQYPMAITVWQENLDPPSLDAVWVKAFFWQKVTTPISFDWENTPAPQGKLEPLIQYLTDLGPSVYWNENKFEHVPNNTYYLRTEQETFWLRVISALMNKKEEEANKLLTYNPFQTTSWFPELETALKRVLAYRKNRNFQLDKPIVSIQNLHPTPLPKMKTPLFFEEMETLAAEGNGNGDLKDIPEPLKALLLSNEVFSAVFLAVDWYEAGLQLHQLPVIPNEFPDWVALNITSALSRNRSTNEALEFASVQKPSPDLSLLSAELLIAGGDSSAALEKLDKLSKLDSEIGYQAAWLASQLYIEQKQWEKARNTVLSQPRLVQEVLGEETLARIAHLQGDTDLADKLYGKIENKSPEARSYLAKRAFGNQNWARAKELTEKLIVDYPENSTLQDNLEKINEQIIQAEVKGRG